MKYFALIIALFGGLSLSAQNSLLEEGDYYFDTFTSLKQCSFTLKPIKVIQ